MINRYLKALSLTMVLTIMLAISACGTKNKQSFMELCVVIGAMVSMETSDGANQMAILDADHDGLVDSLAVMNRSLDAGFGDDVIATDGAGNPIDHMGHRIGVKLVAGKIRFVSGGPNGIIGDVDDVYANL